MMLRLEQFSGIAPKISNRLLPPNAAVTAANVRLRSGELRGIHALTQVHQFSSSVNSAVRIPDTPTDIWLGFADADVDFLKGPLINDAYDRYYWTGDTTLNYPAYNTKARIAAGNTGGNAPYRLGVPSPTAAPTLSTVTGGTAELTETRAYVYTFVNELGEESAPSAPVVQSGPSDGTWNLTNISVTMPDSTNRCPAAKRRIYRTVTGQASSLFYFVADINDMVTTVYDDSIESSTVVQNNVCESFDWDVPPDTLTGLTAHPGGFLAGFVGREVYLSEPYRPWAWPVQYILAIEHDIVGLAVYGNMLMVMTDSNPYYFAGTHPTNVSPTKSQSIEPCTSKRSIVATLQGVLYSSPNGLVLFNESGASVVTNPILSRQEWQRGFNPNGIKATQRGLEYLAFYNSSRGFNYAPSEPFGQLSTFDRFYGIDDIFTDRYTGSVHVVASNIVYEWDSVSNVPVFYTWKSKVYDIPRPENFGAFIVKMDDYEYIPPDNTLKDAQQAWNTTRMGRPLNPLGYAALGGKRWAMTPNLGTGKPNFPPTDSDEMAGEDRRVYPLGGSPLFDTNFNYTQTGALATVTFYADGQQVAELQAQPNKTMRLPSGFKAHTWQVEVNSNVPIYSVAIASTAKELMNG